MEKSKRILLFSIISIFSLIELHSQAVVKPKSLKFQAYAVSLPRTLRTQSLSVNQNVPNYMEKKSSARGFALEPVAREVYKNTFGSKFQYIDATYGNGKHGIDGLLYSKDFRGNIRKVHVIEIKSGNASLNTKKNVPQLSKEWILNSIDKSLEEKIGNLSKLQKEINKKNISSSILENKKTEYSKINKERHLLSKTRNRIDIGDYKRFLVTIDYKDGRLTVVQKEVLEETFKDIPVEKRTAKNSFTWSKPKELANFSYLDKDLHKLNKYEIKVRKILFHEFEKALKKESYSESEIQSYMTRLRTDPHFNPSGKMLGEETVNQITAKSIKKTLRNYRLQGSVLKCGFATLAVIYESKSIHDYVEGKISKSDLVFYSAQNGFLISSLIFQKLNPFMNIFFVGIDIAKNLYDYSIGRISENDVYINFVANVSGLFVGGITTNAVLAAMSIGKMGSILSSFVISPIGGAIVGGFVFAISYGITNAIVKWTGRAIVNKYEAIKSREQFDLICTDLSVKYSLDSYY